MNSVEQCALQHLERIKLDDMIREQVQTADTHTKTVCPCCGQAVEVDKQEEFTMAKHFFAELQRAGLFKTLKFDPEFVEAMRPLYLLSKRRG